MEQLGCTPCSPSESANHRDTKVAPDEPLSLSEPAVNVTPHPHNTTTPTSTTSTSDLPPTTPTAAPTSTRDPLSTSEPSLRFPRPQGNRHLANWISSSDPDIMRVTSTNDIGLSESTYELITGTDTESQDGNYTESMSESVSSLDFHRPDDDVNSLAGTEQTFDDESVADGFEPVANPVHNVLEDAEPDTASLEQSTQSQATILASAPDTDADAEYESEDDAGSRSSLDYTQQSLKTPSIPTPEASKIVDRPAEVVDTIPIADEDEDSSDDDDDENTRYSWVSGFRKEFWRRGVEARNAIMEMGFHIPPVVILLIALLIPALLSTSSPPPDLHSPAASSVVTTHITTPTISTTKPSTTSYALSTSTRNAQLVPLENIQQDEWLWGGKKPDLAVFKEQHNQFLIRIPPKVKEAWLSKKCLSFSATRSLHTVPIGISIAEDGMLIKFPQEESHGTVQVEITAQCRPRIHQVFRITFEKGIMKEALERTKNFAQNLTDLVPAAAQEAERRIEEARRSLESASDNVLTASDSLLKDLVTRFHKAHQSLYPIKTEAKERIQKTKEDLSKKVDTIRARLSQKLIYAQDAQDQAKLSLLDAQISAKLWWLKVINKTEHDRYANKAKEFLANKRAEANRDFISRHPNQNNMNLGPSKLWKKVFTGPRCNNKLGRGKRGTQQCNFVV